MSLFERYLTLWVALCIVAGVALGHLFPGLFHVIGSAELAHVNLPVAVLIWLMIIPMLLKVDFAAIAAASSMRAARAATVTVQLPSVRLSAQCACQAVTRRSVATDGNSSVTIRHSASITVDPQRQPARPAAWVSAPESNIPSSRPPAFAA